MILFKGMAAWLVISGVVGVCSALLTWSPDVAMYGKEATVWRLAAAGLYIPVGAIAWLLSDWASRFAIVHDERPLPFALDRADLYAFASVLIGLYLLADALPQVIYWIVIWRTSRGTGFWDAASAGTTDNTVVYWVHVRAQVGAVAAKLLLGGALVAGPERIGAALMRIRKELSTSFAEPQASGEGSSVPRDGA